jgi:MOSC domain-containing protein YiiM
MTVGRVGSIQVGRIAALGPEGVPSAFVKRPVEGAVRAETLGLVGDAQADRRVHGGPDKAVYGYAASHYPVWAAEWPALAPKMQPGGFGENLTIEGLAEQDLCVGDVHGIGSARLQVCQPREPCFKLALHFAEARLPKAMVRSGRSGWYYRVLTPGSLQAGDEVQLLERPLPDFPFDAVLDFLYTRGLEDEALERVAQTDLLPQRLRSDARRELAARHLARPR